MTRYDETDPRYLRFVMPSNWLIPICIVGIAACGPTSSNGPSDWSGTIDTLPSGIVHVANPDRGVWGDQPQWELREVVTIGSRAGIGPAGFGSVSDLAVDVAGRVYVFDRQSQHVQVFDGAGMFVRTIGRPGRGPGEFMANGIEIDPSQHLWVFNQGNLRYTVFDSSGALVKEVRRPGSRVEFAEWRSAFDADGDLYEVIGYHDAAGTQFRLARFDPGVEAFVDTFPIPRYPENTKLFWGVRVLTPNGWWQGTKETYRLANITFAGDTVRTIALARGSATLSAAERDSALQYEREMSRRRVRGEYEVETSVRPTFERVWIDDRDYLWVMLSSDSAMVGTPLDIFDPSGRYLGQLEALHPVDRFVSPIVRGNRIYYVTKDGMDVPFVIVAEIVGRN